MAGLFSTANLLFVFLLLVLGVVVFTAIVNPVYTVIAGVVLSFVALVLMVVITQKQ